MANRRWSKEIIIVKIQELLSSQRRLNPQRIKLENMHLYAAAYHYFGSWKNAVVAAGIDYNSERLRKPSRSWTKEEIVAEIRVLHDMGCSLRNQAIIKSGYGNLYAAAQRFYGKGGWEKAIISCGQDVHQAYQNSAVDRPPPNSVWSKTVVITGIQALVQDNVIPRPTILRKQGRVALYDAGRRLFGSWRNALVAAGIDPQTIYQTKPCGYWSKDRIISDIQRLAAEGERLSLGRVREKHSSLHFSAVKYFGGWAEAVYAAGINYRVHMGRWSTRLWLKELSTEKINCLKANILGNAKNRKEA